MYNFYLCELPQEFRVQCPKCSVVHSQGPVFVEVMCQDELYVCGELVTCCDGHPTPVIKLFDSHEPAQQAANSFRRTIGNQIAFFNGPFVKKSSLMSP